MGSDLFDSYTPGYGTNWCFFHSPLHSVLQHLLSTLGSHLVPIIYHFPRTWLMLYLVISSILISFWCFLFNFSKPAFCSESFQRDRFLFFLSEYCNMANIYLLLRTYHSALPLESYSCLSHFINYKFLGSSS